MLPEHYRKLTSKRQRNPAPATNTATKPKKVIVNVHGINWKLVHVDKYPLLLAELGNGQEGGNG